MLPQEKIIVPSAAQPRPRSVSGSKEMASPSQNSKMRPVTPMPPASSTRAVILSPKKSRALSALKIEARENTTDKSPEGMSTAAL